MSISTLNSPPSIAAAKLLGVHVSDNLKLAKRLESGLPFDAIERLSKKSSLTIEQLRGAVRISPRTLTRRRREGRLSPEESDRLVSLTSLITLAAALFEGDTAGAARWLTSSNRALAGRTPLDIASTEVGTREVEDLIGRLEHGVFT